MSSLQHKHIKRKRKYYLNTVLNFGTHSGTAIRGLPSSYIKWMRTNGFVIIEEMNERTTEPVVIKPSEYKALLSKQSLTPLYTLK